MVFSSCGFSVGSGSFPVSGGSFSGGAGVSATGGSVSCGGSGSGPSPAGSCVCDPVGRFGAVSSFGASSVLGVPCLLALLSRDSVVVASALSLVAALGDLMPPTALAGIFAAQVVDEPNYFKILRKCLLPAFVLDVWGILIIIYSNNVAALIK